MSGFANKVLSAFSAIGDVMRQLDCSDFLFVDFLLRLLKFDPGTWQRQLSEYVGFMIATRFSALS